ncbi:hypothetical protein RRG08_042585 [Elysia crispata]|uniref:Uncharacterized protein n=1 Tax=Elysia crispata TaxID=231223 RepID=A0AAE0XQE4_9GAST|nr:hypothetical protein RRG08_042585 [Elysia crispata]
MNANLPQDRSDYNLKKSDAIGMLVRGSEQTDCPDLTGSVVLHRGEESQYCSAHQLHRSSISSRVQRSGVKPRFMIASRPSEDTLEVPES